MSCEFPVRRENWEILGDGYAIAWDDLDEHIGIEGLLAGKSSGESDRSFKRWLATKAAILNLKNQEELVAGRGSNGSSIKSRALLNQGMNRAGIGTSQNLR